MKAGQKELKKTLGFLLACDKNKDVIICMDDNLDNLEENKFVDKFCQNQKLQKLYNIRQNLISSKNLILHNKKATYHKLESSSRIDHIY